MAFSHETVGEGATNDWLTPPHIFKALGPFDLDPCASVDQPWDTASHMICPPDDGLVIPWRRGRVWLNPPYGKETYLWLNKLAEHGNGIALTFARTETKGFVSSVWEKADLLLFLHGRVKFRVPVTGEPGKTNAGSPSVLIAYGAENMNALRMSGLEGTLVMPLGMPEKVGA